MSDDTHHSPSTLDRLIHSANQIGGFFATQKHDQAVAGTSNHIAKFWDPRMRQMIFAHLKTGGEGLTPLAREAIEVLAKKQTA